MHSYGGFSPSPVDKILVMIIHCDNYIIIVTTVAMMHLPDVERILFLLPLLFTKQAVNLDLKFDQTGSMVAVRKEDLHILNVVSGILDIALSIAASVISSLLLLSGDIEQNPGPGMELCCMFIHYCLAIIIICTIGVDLDYNNVDATQVLSKLPCDLLTLATS